MTQHFYEPLDIMEYISLVSFSLLKEEGNLEYSGPSLKGHSRDDTPSRNDTNSWQQVP